MSILVNKNSKIVVQGITGSEGTFHTTQMLEYGTNIVAGVTPGKGGQTAIDGRVPVYNSVEEAKIEADANTSIIFVPPPFAAEAVIEASYAGMDLIVCITEGIPVQDMVTVKRVIDENGTRLIGPNCPGIITVDECKLGIMPGFICEKGNIGVISKSGTLTYEAIGQLVSNGMGQTTALGIGGDPIIGTTFIDLLDLFSDENVSQLNFSYRGIDRLGNIVRDDLFPPIRSHEPPNKTGRHLCHGTGRRQKHGRDPGIEIRINISHRSLEEKIVRIANPPQNIARFDRSGILDQKLVGKRIDGHIVKPSGFRLQKSKTLFESKRSLFLRIYSNRYDKSIKKFSPLPDHIHVTVGYRIESARVYCLSIHFISVTRKSRTPYYQ